MENENCTDAVNLHLHVIPVGTIGIVHETKIGGASIVSVIRDDCKAARKAIREATI